MSHKANLMTRWVGKCVYKNSGKPFQNKQLVATVTGIGEHPITHHPAYHLEGCEGMVETRKCSPLVPDPTVYTQTYLDRLDAGADKRMIQGELSREIDLIDTRPTSSESDDRRVALSALESSLNTLMHYHINLI